MNTVTLGYEDDTNISKSDIGKLQLIEAITLFLDGKYICAITLAGAAEMVFAGLLASRDQTHAVEGSADSILRHRALTGLAIGGDRSRNQLFNDWNDSRNKLKHHRRGEEENLTINLFDEAYWMIRRAIANANKLGLQISNQDDFENWIVLNINM